jgi:hypothetical protein
MTTVLCMCQVGDFDAWRPQFERDVAAQPGVQSYQSPFVDAQLSDLVRTFHS